MSDVKTCLSKPCILKDNLRFKPRFAVRTIEAQLNTRKCAWVSSAALKAVSKRSIPGVGDPSCNPDPSPLWLLPRRTSRAKTCWSCRDHPGSKGIRWLILHHVTEAEFLYTPVIINHFDIRKSVSLSNALHWDCHNPGDSKTCWLVHDWICFTVLRCHPVDPLLFVLSLIPVGSAFLYKTGLLWQKGCGGYKLESLTTDTSEFT